MEQFSLFFVQRFKGKVLFDVPMAEYTSIRAGGSADVMAFPGDEADLRDVLTFAASKKYPVFVLGAGSNLLVRDGGIRGVVVNMSEGFKDVSWSDEGEETVRASVGAGVGLGALVRECVERGLSGIEFAEGIPGTVGGAVRMNAGAWGAQMEDVTEGVEVMASAGRNTGKKNYVPAADMGFSYRSTRLDQSGIVVRARMVFVKKDPAKVAGAVDEFRRRRREAAPVRRPNAGSVFKNPPGEVAGRLIDEAGLKGHRIGDAMISEEYGNYIVNMGHATARDVLALMALARDRVYRARGIDLEPEVKVVGEG